MGRYLDALKKVEKVGDDYPNKPKELEKGGILGLLGTPPPRFEINNAANDGDQDNDNNRHYRWLIHFPERDPVHTCCLPEPTHAEVMAMYPDAIAAEPMPERIRHQATPEQEAELKALVAAVGKAYAFTHAEQQEALALALSDPDAALQGYRAMAAELGNDLEHDDRRHCDQCANLRRDVCTIAEPKAGALVMANRGYRPVREPPRRCAGYALGPDDPDKRTGRERWPGI